MWQRFLGSVIPETGRKPRSSEILSNKGVSDPPFAPAPSVIETAAFPPVVRDRPENAVEVEEELSSYGELCTIYSRCPERDPTIPDEKIRL